MGIRKTEFIILMAAMMALVAFAIDAMLPALAFMANDFALVNNNDRQLIITVMFAGLALGQFFYGPLSDSIGRKPAVMLGLSLFTVATVLCLVADNFYLLLIGRFLQGLGAAAPRNISTAIVRDGFKGDEMARLMSIIMAVFVAVPLVAPALGQLILLFSGWRMIFVGLLVVGLVLMLWFAARQPETLMPEQRQVFSLRTIFNAFKETFLTKATTIYTIVNGLIFGSFISFLISSQQMLQEDYGTGKLYVVYFAILVLAFSLASMINSRLVMRLGAAKMSEIALAMILLISVCFMVPLLLTQGKPSLALLMAYLLLMFFSTGLLMGNINALALAPLGHIAGTASAFVAGISMIIAVLVAMAVGQNYAGTLYPLVISFLLCSLLSLLITQLINKTPK